MTGTGPRWLGLQVAAVVVGAVLAAVVAVLYSEANGSWQDAVREETRRDAAIVETVRQVYEAEAPEAFRIGAARVRAEALRDVAVPSRTATSERVVAEQLAFHRAGSLPPGTLGADPRYALPGGAYDVPLRVAHAVAAAIVDTPGGPLPDPARSTAAGDAAARTAQWVAVLTVVLTGLVVVAAARPARRRPDDDSGLIPQPGTAPPARRRTATLLLVLWAAGVLLPFAQLVLSGEEQRAQAEAARLAVRLSTDIELAQTRAAFRELAERDALFAGAVPLAREYATYASGVPAADAAAERALAGAEEVAAAAVESIAVRMGAAATVADGLDPATAAGLGSGVAEQRQTLAAQQGQADRAELFGALSTGSVVALAVLAAVTALAQVRAGRAPAADPAGPPG